MLQGNVAHSRDEYNLVLANKFNAKKAIVARGADFDEEG